MKKIIILFALITIVVVSCDTSDTTKDEQTEIKTLELSVEQEKQVSEVVSIWLDGALSGSVINLSTNRNNIVISLIKPIYDLEVYYNVFGVEEAVKSLSKSSVFETIAQSIREETGIEFDYVEFKLFENTEMFEEGRFYTYKLKK